MASEVDVRILLVEDDPAIAANLSSRLSADGFTVDVAPNLGEAVEAVLSAPYRAVLLDRRLPDGDGLSLLPVLRTRKPCPPVLLVTALDDVPDRVAGLEAGADDYLIKPFAYDELRARLLTRIRRSPAEPPAAPLRIGRLEYDLGAREARVDDSACTFPGANSPSWTAWSAARAAW
jgi:DNA-binding response OmpR family regulator